MFVLLASGLLGAAIGAEIAAVFGLAAGASPGTLGFGLLGAAVGAEIAAVFGIAAGAGPGIGGGVILGGSIVLRGLRPY